MVSYAHAKDLIDEIALTCVLLNRLIAILRDAGRNGQVLKIAPLIFTGARALAKLCREHRALTGETADGLSGAIATALDELAAEWGVDI